MCCTRSGEAECLASCTTLVLLLLDDPDMTGGMVLLAEPEVAGVPALREEDELEAEGCSGATAATPPDPFDACDDLPGPPPPATALGCGLPDLGGGLLLVGDLAEAPRALCREAWGGMEGSSMSEDGKGEGASTIAPPG